MGGGGVAVDHHSSPPHLYVADTANNRILCFNDVRGNPTTADFVLGQTDSFSSLYNSPGNDSMTMTQTGLSVPTDVAVDANGNVWVADAGNGRVLRYPAPFSQPAGSPILPTVVLGQLGFFGTPITDASIETMNMPYGLAIFRRIAGGIRCGAQSHPDLQNARPAAIFRIPSPPPSCSARPTFKAAPLGSSRPPDWLRLATCRWTPRTACTSPTPATIACWSSAAANNLEQRSHGQLEVSTFNQPQGIR